MDVFDAYDLTYGRAARVARSTGPPIRRGGPAAGADRIHRRRHGAAGVDGSAAVHPVVLMMILAERG